MSTAPITIDDLYLYAMHLLDAGQSAQIELFLHDSPEAQQELQQIHIDLACLALSVEPEAVTEISRTKFLSSVADEPRSVNAATKLAPAALQALPTYSAQALAEGSTASLTSDTVAPRLGKIYEDPSQPGFFARLLPWAGWAVAAGLALSTWTFYQRTMAMQGDVEEARNSAAQASELSRKASAESARAKTVLETLGSRSAQRFLLTRQNTTPAPSAHVTYLASAGSLVFQGNNLENIPTQKTYELWLIPADKAAKPIPAGTFKPDSSGFASLILPSLPKGVTAATFGITMEDAGGSESPTLPILLIGM